VSRLRDERGFTVIEMAVSSFIALVVFSATLLVFEAISRQHSTTERTNDSQAIARVTLDRMTRQLRNLASPDQLTSVAGTLPRSVDRNLPLDLVFQDVDQDRPTVTSNAANVRRVRYCLDGTTNPSRGKLYLQTQTWTTATAPLTPPGTECPAAGWNTTTTVTDYVTNQIGARPFFTYSGDAGVITATDSSSRADIARIEARLFVDLDPAKRPLETVLRSSVFLRNQNREPASAFTLTVTNPTTRTIQLNGSASSDPEGQPLDYRWVVDGTEITTRGIVVQISVAAGTHTFVLKARDPAGLEGVSPTQTRTL
jgi:type II secretory pathway component PulJ